MADILVIAGVSWALGLAAAAIFATLYMLWDEICEKWG